MRMDFTQGYLNIQDLLQKKTSLKRAVSMLTLVVDSVTSVEECIMLLDLISDNPDQKLQYAFFKSIFEHPRSYFWRERLMLWDSGNNEAIGELKSVEFSNNLIIKSSRMPAIRLYRNFNEYVSEIDEDLILTRAEAKLILWSLAYSQSSSASSIDKAWKLLARAEGFPFEGNLSGGEKYGLYQMNFIKSKKIKSKTIKNLFYNQSTNIATIIFKGFGHDKKLDNNDVDRVISVIQNERALIESKYPCSKVNVWFYQMKYSKALQDALAQNNFETLNAGFIDIVSDRIDQLVLKDSLKFQELVQNNEEPSISRVGGLPMLPSQSSTHFEWPHIWWEKEQAPLRFLAQVVLGNGKKAYVFYSTVGDISPREPWQLRDGANAVLVEGEEPPPWIRMISIPKTEAPFWTSEMEEFLIKDNSIEYTDNPAEDVSSKNLKPLFKIPTWYRDLEINFSDGKDLLVYEDKNGKLFLTETA